MYLLDSKALIFKMICINLLAKAKLLTENWLFTLILACLEIIVFWNENNMPCAIGMQLTCGVWLSVCICTSLLCSSNPSSQKKHIDKTLISRLRLGEGRTNLHVTVGGWLFVSFVGTAAIRMHVREIGRLVDLDQTRVCIFPKIVFGFHKSLTAFNNLSFVSLRNVGVLDLLQNKFLWSFSFSNTWKGIQRCWRDADVHLLSLSKGSAGERGQHEQGNWCVAKRSGSASSRAAGHLRCCSSCV